MQPECNIRLEMEGLFSDSRRRLSEMKMWTVYGHGHAHGEKSEDECKIEIQRKGVDGKNHDADGVELVD